MGTDDNNELAANVKKKCADSLNNANDLMKRYATDLYKANRHDLDASVVRCEEHAGGLHAGKRWRSIIKGGAKVPWKTFCDTARQHIGKFDTKQFEMDLAQATSCMRSVNDSLVMAKAYCVADYGQESVADIEKTLRLMRATFREAMLQWALTTIEDKGTLKTTVREHIKGIRALNMKEADWLHPAQFKRAYDSLTA